MPAIAYFLPITITIQYLYMPYAVQYQVPHYTCTLYSTVYSICSHVQ